LSSILVMWDQLTLSEPTWNCSEDAIKFNKYQENMRVMLFIVDLKP